MKKISQDFLQRKKLVKIDQILESFKVKQFIEESDL